MSNSNYNLSLKAHAHHDNDELEFDFDPYNDCTDMDGLLELATEKLNEQVTIPEDEDRIEQDEVTVKIIDFDNIPEKWANENDCWDFAEAFAECDQDIEVVEAALECDVAANCIDEAYQGEYGSDEDFAESMADDLGLLGKETQWPHTCIDWERAASDLMMDYHEHNGYYFRQL